MQTEIRYPEFRDVLSARQRIRPYLMPTPLNRYASLDALIGTEVWVKHENCQPVGAFKVRGGINLMSSLSAEERARGVITASTGNHGQSVAYAARLFGAHAYICVPIGANPDKVAAIRAMGATIIEQGANFDEAARNAEQLAQAHIQEQQASDREMAHEMGEAMTPGSDDAIGILVYLYVDGTDANDIALGFTDSGGFPFNASNSAVNLSVASTGLMFVRQAA